MAEKGLQIINKNGEKLPINKIDIEICKLLGNEVDPKRYCKLCNEEELIAKTRAKLEKDPTVNKDQIGVLIEWEVAIQPNWFDSIGWMAANNNLSLDEIIESYRKPMEKWLGKTDSDGELITMESIYPAHMKVINYFKEKEYSLVGVEIH